MEGAWARSGGLCPPPWPQRRTATAESFVFHHSAGICTFSNTKNCEPFVGPILASELQSRPRAVTALYSRRTLQTEMICSRPGSRTLSTITATERSIYAWISSDRRFDFARSTDRLIRYSYPAIATASAIIQIVWQPTLTAEGRREGRCGGGRI